ncbi:MAG: hypothetical protein ACI841_001730 [Planctomycetota bacterium]|jgi:hypothetical protein
MVHESLCPNCEHVIAARRRCRGLPLTGSDYENAQLSRSPGSHRGLADWQRRGCPRAAREVKADDAAQHFLAADDLASVGDSVTLILYFASEDDIASGDDIAPGDDIASGDDIAPDDDIAALDDIEFIAQQLSAQLEFARLYLTDNIESRQQLWLQLDALERIVIHLSR